MLTEVVRITLSLVQVDAVVTDGDGRHVTDLQARDFEILEDGRPQEITNCVYISTPGPSLPVAAPAPAQGPTPPALVSALSTLDEAGVRSALFNFAVTTYHVWDWIKAYRPDLAAPATNALDFHESLRACRDLANASKHASLDLTRGPYLKHPPTIQEVVVSAPPVRIFVSPAGSGAAAASPHPWKLKVQLPSRRVAAEDLVAEALDAWKQYFAQHSLK